MIPSHSFNVSQLPGNVSLYHFNQRLAGTAKVALGSELSKFHG